MRNLLLAMTIFGLGSIANADVSSSIPSISFQKHASKDGSFHISNVRESDSSFVRLTDEFGREFLPSLICGEMNLNAMNVKSYAPQAGLYGSVVTKWKDLGNGAKAPVVATGFPWEIRVPSVIISLDKEGKYISHQEESAKKWVFDGNLQAPANLLIIKSFDCK